MQTSSHSFSSSIGRRLGSLLLPAALIGAIAVPMQLQSATAQTSRSSGQGSPVIVRGKYQEYNTKTQVGTIRGDVELVYPARGIQATAKQAQLFNNERQIVLSGDVYIVQQGGNTIRAETVTYLIDEGRFVALPDSSRQVESVYIIRENDINQASNPAPTTPASRRKK
jgi:lipopolysaccharide export system protein LptA